MTSQALPHQPTNYLSKSSAHHGTSRKVSVYLLKPCHSHAPTLTQSPRPVYTTAYNPHPTETMKAALWTGTKSIELGEVPKPTLTAPKDAIVYGAQKRA